MVILVPTHDVDFASVRSVKALRTFFGFVRRELVAGNFSSLCVPHWENFQRWMDLENEYDVRSAFYFLQKGIGGSPYDFNEKISLEKILGKTVQGIRLHFLRISEKSLKLQEKAHFIYDSSLETPRFFRIFHPVVNDVRLNIIEMPLTLHDNTLFVKKKMTLDEAYKYSRKIIDMASRVDGIVTLNWHQQLFSPEWKSWLKAYILILNYAKKIEAKFLKPIDVVQMFQAEAMEFSNFVK